MALNPFFLHGSSGEQNLVQSLVNEHLRMFGLEVIYLPRKIVNRKTIIEEVQTSKFDQEFAIEAYVNTYEGHTGGGDILTKFGISLRDEVTLTISKERFEDFISTALKTMNSEEIILSSRPREGDLVYFPLGKRLFEVKFVEHEQPFYQLGKTYVYELKCELFEYEDEIIDTSVYEVDSQIKEEGFITTLNLIGTGVTSAAIASISTGYIQSITIVDDGSGYTSTPTVAISTAPSGGTNATAVAITTVRSGVYSIKDIYLTNAGAGYTVTPTISIIGGGGSGAIATCSINTTSYGVNEISATAGSGYGSPPTITIESPVGVGTSATAISVINNETNTISAVRIVNPGYGYTALESPTVTVSSPSIISGIGTFEFNEFVYGVTSGTGARVKEWDASTNILKISNVGIGTTTSGFIPGEIIVGTISSARYSVESYVHDDTYDKYTQNDEIEGEADNLLDFTESNPFGDY